MSTLKSECRKFSPNVFNKIKCQNCFRTKNAHSAEALENNRASRNVSKCGYLFVAPDWDFNVSVNRTKRWQRRWFVLYDDGELTYALDEFPDTIPQGVIDMNKVLDVSDAESATGNEFSISITTPDKVHFVKGTSKEESKWWFDVLSRVLPRHLSRGKHKRNATFPCGKATIPTTAVIAQDYCSEDDIRVNNYSRPKFLSSSEIPRNEKDWIQSVDAEEDEDVFPDNHNYPNENNSDDENVRDVEVNNVLNKLISQSEETQEELEGQSNHGDGIIQKDCLSQLEELDARRRNRRYLKRENRIQRNQRSRIDGVSKMIPAKNRQDKNVVNELSDPTPNSNGSAIAAAEKLEYLESIHANEDRPHSARQNTVLDEREKPSSTDESNSKDVRNNPSRKSNLRKSESLKNIPSETQSEIRDHVSGLRRYHSFKSSSCHRKIKQSNGTSSLKRTKLSSAALARTATSSPTTALQSVTQDTKSNSDIKPLSTPDICYEHTSEGVFMRTGWLMRQTLSKDWSRHWFVLRDSSLTYYRDPSAEHCGIMDGILDLNQVSTIRDTETDRYYAFSLRMWDGKKHILAAETDDFRSMWIQGLQYASNLWSSASKEDFICSEIVLPEHTFHHADRSGERISSPSSLSSLPYIYDNSLAENSSSSDDQSEYFSLVDEDEVSDLSSSPRTLPPSPPINRNMISLVKEKSRSRSSSSPKSHIPTTDADCTISSDDISGSNGKYNIDSNLSSYTDTLDSMQRDDGVDISELSTQLLNGDHIISSMKLLAEPPVQHSEDAEYTQFSLEFDDQLPKEHEDQTEANSINPNGPICKPFRSELCNTSTSKSEITDECRMCVIVKSKLIAAKEEIRKLKKELKEAHTNFDNLEMFSYKLAQDIKVKEENYNAQIALMTAKIDDLTYKFTLAEKNYRQLKQKTLKNESKERKRSSLKNREGLSLTKEYELKLCDLEKKIGYIETTIQREPAAVEDFESTRPDSQSKVEESSSLPSELSDASTSTEVSSSSTKGFFSRLQSLGSRVQTVNDLVSEKNTSTNETETPKIRLERDTEGSTKLDESDESWSLSLNHSLKNSNKYREKHPSNLSECHGVFNRKIHKILKWLKTSLEGICKQRNKSNVLMDEKILLIQNLIDLLDSFCSNIHHHNEQKPMQNKTCHTILLAYEAMRLFEKMESIDSIDSLVNLDVTQLAFKVIIRTLCTAFAEYENSELSNTLQFISKIPQIRFFCPIVNKLFPKSQDEIHQFVSVSERLQQLNDQHAFILDIFQQAKKVKYDCLWNILTDVPVQDANVNKPQSLSSILNYVTSIATGIHRIAEHQLSGVQYQSPYVLKTEQEKVQTWCLTAKNELKDNLTSFMDELKEQCPMIHESSVSLFELSDAKRKEITCYVSELSFFSVSYSLLNSLLSHPSKDTHDNDLPSSSMYGADWFDNLSNVSLNESLTFDNTDFFRCPQCSTLNHFLSYSNQELNWSEYIEKYNFYHPRRSESLNFKLENMATNLGGTCSNCDSHFADPAGNNLKDVCNNLTCTECDNWIKKFCASEKQHELECQALESKYNRELQQLEECLIKSSEVHEQEMLQKETELESTTAQLQRLKVEYEEQIQTLKDLYEQKLHFDCDNIDEGSIRQAYKSEVEDLKDMFKKGLVAIENSHYRITTEMEKKHKDEISILRAEKERALELEAQATVTALEAIKKSHQQQLKEETAIIKDDLMRKFQSDEPYETFYNKYGSDLEKLKAEILKITNMYSAKCVENIALEEKVNSLRHQLEEAHNELCGLLKKNKEIDISLLQV